MIIPKCPLFFLKLLKEVVPHRNMITTKQLCSFLSESKSIRKDVHFWVGVDEFFFP